MRTLFRQNLRKRIILRIKISKVNHHSKNGAKNVVDMDKKNRIIKTNYKNIENQTNYFTNKLKRPKSTKQRHSQ